MAAADVAPKAAGVALIAADTGRVLMLQRAHDDPNDPAAGTWEFPGGHVEPSDDSSRHGAVREWQEEVGRRMPKGATVAHAWRSTNGVYAGHALVIPSEDQVNLSGRRVVANPDDDSEQRAWWQIEHAKKNPALRAEARQTTPWNHLSRIAREAQKRMNTKDVYATMNPATYTRGLGSGVGRSPMVIESHPKPPLALAARKLRRRKPVSGAKALSAARGQLETKLDPEILEIYRGARAETKVRHVRTAAGVRRYHAPVGTPIIGGRAVPSLPSAGGGRARAGANAGRATTGLVGGSARRGGAGKGKGGFTGRSRRGLGKRVAGRAVRGGFNGNGGGGLGGGLLGGGLGQIFGGQGPGASAQPKQKKQKKPKQVKPPKAKKGSSTRGSGVKKSSTGKTGTSTPKPTQAQVNQAAQQLVDVPVERLGGILRTMPANVLPMLLNTIQDPEFAQRVAAARSGTSSASGAKSLVLGAALLEVKDAAVGDERCMGCGVDLDPGEEYATLPTGKGYELVVCPPCAEETKAGSGDSGIPGHLPEQLRKYWTTGKGKARWAANPHPYTALANALRSEGVPERVIGGLTAELFRDVFGIWPAQRPRALGGSTHGHGK